MSSWDWRVGSVGFTRKLPALDWVPGPACSQGEDGKALLRQELRAGGQVSGEKGPGLGPCPERGRTEGQGQGPLGGQRGGPAMPPEPLGRSPGEPPT